MLGRPAPLWILGVLGTIGGLLCIIVAMQFAEVIPWAGHEGSHIGGRWTGVVSYGLAAGLFFASAFAWMTVKRWAHMISILAAIVGFFVPFISYMDNTDPRSSALAPIVASVLMLFMVFRPSTNRAMAAALSGQGGGTATKAPPPPKPMSAARKREVAREQQKAQSQAAASSASSPAVAAASVTTTNAAAPVSAAAPATPAKTAASMVMSAASSLRAAAATPASPRKGVSSTINGTVNKAPVAPAPTAEPPRPSAEGVPGLRADEV